MNLDNPFLIGQKVYLRALSIDDVNSSYPNWLNDQEISIYNSHGTFPYSKESAKRFIESVDGSKTNIVLAIVDIEKNIHIGNASLQNIHYINRSAELSILIGDKNYHSKGIAKDVCSMLISHAFLSLGLNRVYLGTNIENLAMQKVATSIGMQQEGIKKEYIYKNGRFYDVIEYAILRKEYDKRI